MNIFDKLKIQNAATRLIEEKLYETVVDDLQNGLRKNGLWAKAFAKSYGDESKAKALYISYRVQSIKDEINITESVREQETDELQRRYQKQEQQEKEREENRKREQEIDELQPRYQKQNQQEKEHETNRKNAIQSAKPLKKSTINILIIMYAVITIVMVISALLMFNN
jgi:hypothetical protein